MKKAKNDKKEQPDPKAVEAATKFVESMLDRADTLTPYPMWHGWALREAFLVGVEFAMEEADR